MKLLKTNKLALNILENFIENHIANYTDRRNYDFGPQDRSNVSCLSPYLSHRVMLEYDVINKVLAQVTHQISEKFIQEVFWRIYWKGWLELHPKVWANYVKDTRAIKLDDNYHKAINGDTTISFFNAWVKELKEFNYLHNHTRMWFASIWIFTLRLPWQLGASFFLEHLYDGDPASNTLSWRWVAGLQTKGKNYLATKTNIEKYSKLKVNDGQLNEYSEPIIESDEYPLQPLQNISRTWNKNKALLICDTVLNQGSHKVNFLDYDKIFILSLDNNKRQINISNKVLDFKLRLQSDFQTTLKKSEIINHIFLENYCENSNEIDVIYPSIGDNLDYLQSLQKQFKIKMNMIHNENDLYCWQFCNKGYFNFKKSIPDMLQFISN